MKLINTRSVNCIYCDDVRHEVSGKITVVGMYPEGATQLYPPQGVLVLAKFCLIAQIRTPADQHLQRLVCQLKLDDEVLHSTEMPPQVLNASTQQREGQKGVVTQLIMEFGNFPIKHEGNLRFVAIADSDQIYECAGLRFTKAEAAQA